MTDEVIPAAPEHPSGLSVDTATRRVTVGVLSAVLAAVALLNSLGRTPVEIKPEVYLAPWHSALGYLSSWQANPQLGFPSFNVGLAPVAALIGVLQSAGLSAGVSAHVLRGLLAAATAWGMARLYRTLVDDRDDVGALAAAVVSVANPYTLVAGSTLAVSLPLALLPWQLVAIVHAVRRGGWRDPALVALTFFLMSGANAGVVPLMQGLAVPVVALVVARHEALGVGRALAAMARSAVLIVLVSLYWIVPAVSATAAGTTVIANSETLPSIADVSSFAEVLRGLGLWPIYGSDRNGPWQPQFTGYLDNGVVIVASFAVPLLMAVAVAYSHGLRRRLAVWLVVPAVVIMVGLNPVSSPSPFGRALRLVFERVPATAAFRTTNKVGAMFVLGLALLLGAGYVGLLRSARRSVRPRVGIACAAILVTATAPAWSGGLYTSFVDVPAYWRQAARTLDAESSQRVWLLPGEAQSDYRWSDPRPDDISLSLLSRPSLIRTVIPATGAGAANLLAAVDTGLQEGWLAPGTLSTAARGFGADTVLLRNDQAWENDGGARPQVLQDVLEADPGLLAVRNYGSAGEYVTPAKATLTPVESLLPPLQQWAVSGARPIVTTTPAAGGVLVSGDGYALDELVAGPVGTGGGPLRYLGDLRAEKDASGALKQALRDGARIALTDTNRRRSSSPSLLTDGQGPLLAASADPGGTRALWNAPDQTVLHDEGATVTASVNGSVFGPLPFSAPENALDGNPATSWQFGDFGAGIGAELRARFGERPVPVVVVHTSPHNRHVTSLRVTLRGPAGTVQATVHTDAHGVARWTPPAGTRADTLVLRVLQVAGRGFNRLSVSEIDAGGVRVRRVAQLPDTLGSLLAHDAPARALLARTPIDVYFARVQGNVASAADDEEAGLDRDLSLPVARTYRAGASVLVRAAVSDATLDRVAGVVGPVRVASTGRLFDGVDVRASQALDGNPGTAWLPSLPAAGQSITVTAPRRTISSVSLLQTAAVTGAPNAATRVRVSLDGRAVAVATAHLGRTTIRIRPQQASTLRVEILRTQTTDPTAAVQVAEIGFGAARVHVDHAAAAHACIGVGTLDGRPLQVHPLAPLTVGTRVAATGCGPLALAAGAHRLRADPTGPFTLDRLALTDRLATAVPPAAAPTLRVLHHDQTSYRLQVSGATGAYWLGLGQSLDPRWRASLDGHDLGTPVLLDGWQTGWRIDGSPGRHTVVVTYGPQRAADIAIAVSALGVVLCGVLVSGVLGRLWRRRGPARPRWPAARVRRRRRSTGRVRVRVDARVRWVFAAVVGFVAGGWLAAAAVALVAAWCLLGRASTRRLALASAIAFATVPVLWLALRPDVAVIAPALVSANPWPGRAALIALVLLIAAVAVDDTVQEGDT